MGENFSRSLQACWDPEGTAAIVRKKKAQRACIDRYTEIFKELSEAATAKNESAIESNTMALRSYDLEVRNKLEGKFLTEMQMHNDWKDITKKRSDICSLLQNVAPEP
eukprot:TRINITY_DN62090_c0_g1_i1.p2 TRINITY_DN62090_c0_g1~~TRINITY_DN62090_c0_g1_i1.p2  ORF type:complete len:108 (+),score=25.60 TRINITY_DN62090_c0_g1_i1:152-475(+)